MPKWKPLKGMKFGKLTVLEDFRDETKCKSSNHYCKCQCDCENETIVNVASSRLLSGEKVNCGCERSPTKYIRNPLKGKRFGNLVVLEDYIDMSRPKGKRHMCKCECQCKSKTIVYKYSEALQLAKYPSCGCIKIKNKKVSHPIKKKLKGKKFGRLTVLDDYMAEIDVNKRRHMCICQCSCKDKNIIHMRADILQKATNPSCGCENPSAWKDLKGQQFGSLVVMRDFKENKTHMCECKCECGRIRVAEARKLNAGYIKSCGVNHVRPDLPNLSQSRFGRILRGIKTRCNNPNDATYYGYGSRGIKCLWEGLDDFYVDMYESYCQHVEEYGEYDTTIERIDVNGNYCKENCRWVTVMEQEQNKRNTHKIIDVDGELLSVSGYCRKYNLPYYKIQHFGYKQGLNVKQALEFYLKEQGGEILYEQVD